MKKLSYEQRIERKFFEMIERRAIEIHGDNKTKIAEVLFAGHSDKRRTFYSMKGTTPTGEPLRVRLGDAIMMCARLGEQFEYFMFKVRSEVDADLAEDAPGPK